jgi:uncharacterized protein (TIGR03545 family)
MKRLLQWQFVVPRVLLVIVLLLAAQYVLGIVAQSIAIQHGGAALSACVDVGHARVSFVDGQVVLNDVRIANPERPSKSFLEADRCELHFSTAAMLHKQAVVEKGRISGLRFGTYGETATAAKRQSNVGFSDDADVAAQRWLDRLSERFSPGAAQRLDSVRRLEAFRANWSVKSTEMDLRLQDLDRRAAELQAVIEAGQANPLRNDKLFADLPKKATDLQKDFKDFQADIEELPDQLEAGRRAIIAARRNDQEAANNQPQLEAVDSNALSAYLLREQAARQLNELVGWLRWARAISTSQAQAPATVGRGENILFAGCRRGPGFLVRSLELQGAAKFGGQPVEMRGTLTNLASDPKLCGQPLRLHLIADGSLPFELQATIDRTTQVAKDELLVDCKGILLPAVALGRSKQLELNLAPSIGSVSVSIVVDGERLSGDVQIVQQRVQLSPVASGANNAAFASAMCETLERVNSVATRLSLGGTLEEPSCALWSNLGTAVAEAMKGGLQRAEGQYSKALLVEAGRHVDERLAEIDRQVAEKQTRFAAKSTEIGSRLQKIASGESPRYRISAEQGGRLPHTSLFR